MILFLLVICYYTPILHKTAEKPTVIWLFTQNSFKNTVCGRGDMASTQQIWSTLLSGVKDDGSVLSCLRGVPHILTLIYQLVINEFRWKKCIQLPDVHLDGENEAGENGAMFKVSTKKHGKDSFLFLTQVLGRFELVSLSTRSIN